MKMFVFEGTPEEISAVARSILPAATGDVALSVEVEHETRVQSAERPTKFVTVDFAHRVLNRRPVLSKAFKRVLDTLNDAHPNWLLLTDLHRAAEYTPAQYAGLMGAFGRRMSHTEGYDKDVHFLEFRWNDEKDAWEHRLPLPVRAVSNRLQRSEMESFSFGDIKNLASNRGPNQDLAFDELARRIRKDPLSWNPSRGPWAWNHLDITRAPNAIEAEWAFLGWSHQLLGGTNPELEQEQEQRLDEIQYLLDQDPESHEISRKFHEAIGVEVHIAVAEPT